VIVKSVLLRRSRRPLKSSRTTTNECAKPSLRLPSITLGPAPDPPCHRPWPLRPHLRSVLIRPWSWETAYCQLQQRTQNPKTSPSTPPSPAASRTASLSPCLEHQGHDSIRSLLSITLIQGEPTLSVIHVVVALWCKENDHSSGSHLVIATSTLTTHTTRTNSVFSFARRCKNLSWQTGQGNPTRANPDDGNPCTNVLFLSVFGEEPHYPCRHTPVVKTCLNTAKYIFRSCQCSRVSQVLVDVFMTWSVIKRLVPGRSSSWQVQQLCSLSATVQGLGGLRNERKCISSELPDFALPKSPPIRPCHQSPLSRTVPIHLKYIFPPYQSSRANLINCGFAQESCRLEEPAPVETRCHAKSKDCVAFPASTIATVSPSVAT